MQQFYNKLADDASLEELKKLYQRLANFETKHKARLVEESRKQTAGDAADPLSRNISPEIMEGGGKVSDFLRQVQPYLNSRTDVLELAMMLETQALDLYSRMAQKSSVASTRELFLRLADEEKVHLGFLAKELDNVLK